MGTKTNVLIGVGIGSVVGFVAGSLLADHFAPEYYTDEELAELEGLLESNDYAEPAQREKPKKIVVGADHKMKKSYASYFAEKTDGTDDGLHKLIKKYNTEEEVEVEEDNEVDDLDEVEFLEEETILENYQDYLATRDETLIYIMSRDEYENSDSGFKQMVLNYYPEDDVLTDDKDKPLAKMEKIIGEEALSNFGTFSDDPETIYVCNPRLKGEYEIIRFNGSYDDIVLGNVPEVSKKVKKAKDVNNIFEEEVDVES